MLSNPRRRGALVLAAALLAGCGGGGGGDEKQRPGAVRLRRLEGTRSRGQADVARHERGPRGRRLVLRPGQTRVLKGFLLTPSNTDGRHPAVIYAHGARGNRQELLDQAMQMAEEGAVALTLNMIY